MAFECFTGETVRVTASDLTHSTEGAITADAVVTVDLYHPDGTLISSDLAVAEDDDWSYDLTAPTTPGQYEIRVTAVALTATAKDKVKLTVRPF